MGYVNDYNHYFRLCDGWVTYYRVDSVKGEQVVWKIPILAFVALSISFPIFWTVIMIRARRRRHARGFEVVTGDSIPTRQPSGEAK
jgi:hypothetical protein